MRRNRKNDLTISMDSATEKQGSELYLPSTLLELDDLESNHLTVVFRSDHLGGDDDLGQRLLVEAVSALTRHPEPPEAILFYHRGVRLISDQSQVLEPLRLMQEKGSCLLICETSLAAYPDLQTAVGRAVPLAELIEQMRRASRMIWF